MNLKHSININKSTNLRTQTS